MSNNVNKSDKNDGSKMLGLKAPVMAGRSGTRVTMQFLVTHDYSHDIMQNVGVTWGRSLFLFVKCCAFFREGHVITAQCSHSCFDRKKPSTWKQIVIEISSMMKVSPLFLLLLHHRLWFPAHFPVVAFHAVVFI